MSTRAVRWHRVSELFDRVVDLGLDDRARLLADECAEDPELRIQVERLLAADERTSPVDRDIAGQASLLLLEGDPHEHEGQCFGPYRIVRLLGQGGMGRVYLAEREGEDFAQTVALKLVGGHGSFDAALARRRFLDERRMLARLQHPNIARLLDGGLGPEAQPWFAMEYVDGAPLTQWCDQRQLGVHARLSLFAKVCDAVDHAHRFLIVHRDLKPGNVLVDAQGEPKVLDFGIAKLLDEGAQQRTGSTILMTPDYAAPEQIRGGQISTATDVYALGAVLFELLTGRKPFCDPLASREPPQASRVATEIGEAVGDRARDRSTTPHSLRKSLRGDLDRILRTALDPEPARRYRSAATLAQDLRAIVSGRTISLRSDTAYRVRVFLRRHRLGVAATVAVAIAACAFVWRLDVERERAQVEAETAKKVSDFLVDTFNAADPRMRGSKGAEEPTARHVLDSAADKVNAELEGSPAMLARMRAVLGRAYANLGERKRSEQMLRQAAEAFESAQIARPDLAAEAYNELSTLFSNQQRADDALAAANKSLDLTLRHNPTATALAEAYQALGLAKKNKSDFAGARAAYTEALALSREVHGAESLETAYVLHNIASLQRAMGDFAGAEGNFRQALGIKLKYGENAVTVHNSRQGLASTLGALGRFDEAVNFQRQNIRLAEALYGRDSENASDSEMKLAMLLQQTGDYLSAEEHYRDSLEITDKMSARGGLDYAVLAFQQATLKEARGDYASAERLYREALAIRSEKLPPGDSEVLISQAYLGRFLMRTGKVEEARSLLEAALPTWLAFFEAEDVAPELVAAKLIQAEWLMHEKKWDEAEAALFDTGKDLPGHAIKRRALSAELAQRRGQGDEALRRWGETVDFATSRVGADSAVTAQWRVAYAQTLLAAGDVAAAAVQLRRAEPPLRKFLVADAEVLRQLDNAKAELMRTGAAR